MGEATKSHLAMFRATIALAWADHELDVNEKERILVYIDNNRQLAEAQKDQLRQDLLQPISIDAVWPEITDVQDRAHLINIADAIFWEDGDFCHSEQEVYEKIKAAHMATLDIDAIREDISAYREVLAVERQQFESDLNDIKMRGPFGRMMSYLETMVDRVF